MAGEVEESFSINFQVDSIHSGSISFGRFESEPLSWERRSSFNHNRYLEEVEKCSKPGSVIQKKAYFEAHFKKKGLLGIMPSAGHEGSYRATSESDDDSERIGNQEDFESNDCYYVQFDQTQEDFEPNEDEHHVQIEQGFHDDFEPNEDDYYGQFDQRTQEDFQPEVGGQCVKMEQGSQEEFESNEDGCDQFGDVPVRYETEYQGECEVIGYGRNDTIKECPMVSFPNPQLESAMDSSNNLGDATNKNITLDEAGHFDNERSNALSVNDDAIIEVKRDDNGTVNTNELSRNMSMSVNELAQDVEKTILHDPANPSPKKKKKEPEPGLNSEVNNLPVQKSACSRSPRNPGGETPRRMNMGKNLSKLDTPTSRSATRTHKEVSKSLEKLSSNSGKVPRAKKAAESQSSVLKTDSRGIQEAERLNRTFNPTKSDVRPRAATFNFKCGERAERRKEFYMKLEEKFHAKEAEMNQMQAISEEKKEADIKKLRKSLNFKATPMPSFYRTTLPSQSQGNQALSKKPQNKPKRPGSGPDAAMPLKSKIGNYLTAKESATTKPHSILIKGCTETKESEASLIHCSSPSTSQSCLSNSVTKNHTLEKKEGAKVTTHKHRVPESCKGAEVQSNGGNKNGETTKQRNETMRKGVSSSRSGNNLTVRVAS